MSIHTCSLFYISLCFGEGRLGWVFSGNSFPLHVDSDWTDYTDHDIMDYRGSMLSYVANVFNELKYAVVPWSISLDITGLLSLHVSPI